MSRRVIVYLRVSTEDQTQNYSLGTQRSACLAFAQAQGWTVVDTVTEARTATNDRRPVFQSVLARIRAGEANTLLVHSQDRFSRSMRDTLNLLDEVGQANGEVWTVKEGYLDDSNAIRTLVVSIGAFAGQSEIETKRERTKRGMRGRAAAGRLTGGRSPYGYRYPEDERLPDGRLARYRLEEDPATAPVVRRIFVDVAGGASIRSVTHALTAEGIRRPKGEPGAPWGHMTVYDILNNPAYRGDGYSLFAKRVGKTVQTDYGQAVRLPEGTVPALVTGELWDAAQRALAVNRQRHISTLRYTGDVLLRGGFIRCGGCGRKLSVMRNTPTGPRYSCPSNPREANPCPARTSIMASIIDGKIWSYVTDLYQHPEMVRDELERLRASDPTTEERRSLVKHRAEVTREHEQIALRMALAADEATAAVLSRLASERAGQLTHLDARIDLLSRQQRAWDEAATRLGSIEAGMREKADRLAAMDTGERRQELDRLGVVVRLFPTGSAHRFVATAQPLGDLALYVEAGESEHKPVTAEQRRAQVLFELEQEDYLGGAAAYGQV